MDANEIVIEGTLTESGTLELDAKPNLPPGRVTVVLRPDGQTGPTQEEGWWPYMQRVRAEREAAGYPFMDERQMQAHLDWLRDDEDRIERLHREMDHESRIGQS